MVRRGPSGLFLLVLATIFSLGTSFYAVRQTSAQMPPAAVSKDDYYLLMLANKDRQAAGLQPLQLNKGLLASASAKCQDMVTRNYWGHITPEGRGMDMFLTKAGIKTYSKAAENLAIGQASLEEVNNDWMNSPPHRESILGVQYTEVGFGECSYKSDIPTLELTNLYVEHFLAR